MSKIGKQPIELPEGVKVEISGSTISVTGSKGTLEREIPRELAVEINGQIISVSLKGSGKSASAIFGTTRAEIANMVKGVSEGWTKILELVGTGYRAEVTGDTLILTVGYSHPVKIKAPEGISFTVEKTMITISGRDKQKVGDVAARIRAVRPPEPYKGKGIKYKDEEIRRKAGKAAKTVGSQGAVG